MAAKKMAKTREARQTGIAALTHPTAEAAKLKGLSPRTLTQHALRGHVPGAMKIGWRERDLDVLTAAMSSGRQRGEGGRVARHSRCYPQRQPTAELLNQVGLRAPHQVTHRPSPIRQPDTPNGQKEHTVPARRVSR